MRYKEGLRVMISPQGRERYIPSERNPFNIGGQILEVLRQGRSYRVLWDNGNKNTYRKIDLNIEGESSDQIVILRKMVAIYQGSNCRNCAICREICPMHAIYREDGRHMVNARKCDGCGICIDLCPNKKIVWTNIVADTTEITDEDKTKISEKYPIAPRTVAKAADWMGKKKSRIAAAADTFVESLGKVNGNFVSLEGAETMLALRKFREAIDGLPYSTLGEAAGIIKRGFMNPRETSLREIEGVLNQFCMVSYEDGTLTVVTKEDIIVHDVNFGQFRIELHIPGSSLNVTAINPNWGLERRRASHPHIDNDGGGICLGAGVNAFDKAIRDGRICDALLVVQGVLNEYGDENPYHPIEAWTEKECYLCQEDGARYSHRCAQDSELKYICDDHAIFCSHCGRVACAYCVAQCSECGEPLCGICAALELCEHKSDPRNREWVRRGVEDAKKWKTEEGVNGLRERIGEQITVQIERMRKAAKECAAADEQRRKLQEERERKEREAEEYRRLSERKKKEFLAGRPTPDGYAGFLGDESIDDLRDRHAQATDSERAAAIAGGTCPACGEAWCEWCNCCHECGFNR